MFTSKDLQSAEQLRRALQMYAQSLPPEAAREVATVYPTWTPGMSLDTEAYVTRGTDANGDPILYRTTQAFTAAAEHPPENTPGLYVRVSLDESGHPIWSAPTGAHDAYDTGDVVRHSGQLWRSRRDGNTSEPGTDEWWEVYEEV